MNFIYGIDDIERAVDVIMPLLKEYHVVTFTGSLGAGKTTLVRALLQRCGVQEVITSPTFAYVNTYYDAQGHTYHHFDLYRLSGQDEFVSLGFGDYVKDAQAWSFIEWPEVIKPLLGATACHITLDYEGLDQRSMTILQGSAIR